MQEDEIVEDIESDEDDKQNDNNQVFNLLESGGQGHGVTVSQSLGIDKSVDSLALDEYDHVEYIED